jgi:hypothetical protein
MALAKAVASNDLEAVVASLAGEGKQELNSYGSSGELLLQVAIRSSNLAVAEELLKTGANVNQPNEERGTTKGYTAVHFAARSGDVDALNLLAKYKADINRTGADGWAPIHAACFAGKSAAMRRLVELGADVNVANDHGMIPLVFAANHGRVADVRFLIKKGADVHFTDSNGDSLMHHALHFRLQEMFEGAYDMPECQFDVAVCLAVNGAPVDTPNHSGHRPCKWMHETDIPAFESVMKILSHNSDAICKAGGSDLNYISLLAAQAPVFEAMGVSKQHARDLANAIKECDEQRLAEKKRREEERPAGGCPVMKGGRKKKGDADKAGEAKPDGHPPVDMSAVPEGTDPSNGQCPFFSKKAKQEANSGGAASEAASKSPSVAAASPAVASSSPVIASSPQVSHAPAAVVAVAAGKAPALNWQTAYEHRTVILLVLVAFFFGGWVERHFGNAMQRLNTSKY